MRRLLAIAALSGIVASGTAAAQGAAAQQTRPGQTTPQPASPRDRASGVLRGVVIAADTGGPLRRARVTLTAPGLRETRAATTDLQGRWEFKDLPAGRFTLTASKAQYVTLQHGQRIPTEDGRPIELGAGQVMDRLEFRLPRGSVIAGRVLDDLGEPAESVMVQAFRLEYVNGQRQLGPAGTFAQTDDLGQYRLAGLPPGTYYVGSAATRWVSGSPEDAGISFGETYAPGTLRAGEAQPVVVRVGQERPSVNIDLQAVRLAAVSGLVVDSEGIPIANSRILVIQERQGAAGSTSTMSSADAWTTGADGRFTIPNLAPGDYSFASFGTSPVSTAAAERGSAFVQVSGQDVSGVVIALYKGSRATGQVTFEGEPQPPRSPAIRILAAEPAGSRGMSSLGTSVIADDWSFEVSGISPGKRVFRVAGLPATHTLKSVFIDAEEVIDTETEFDGKGEIHGVRLVVSSRVTTVSGLATDDRGRPIEEYALVVFSSDPERWGRGTRYVATARPDQTGRFTVTGLPPGDYLVAALNYLERGESTSPEFLASIRSDATSVRLVEGETRMVSLKAIAPER
jgi:hypothetical protein